MRITMSNSLKLAAAAGVLAVGGLLAASPAQAAKYSNWQDAAKHFELCAEWLISNPAKHAKYCDPGHVVFVSSGGFGAVCHYDCCGDYSSASFIKPKKG